MDLRQKYHDRRYIKNLEALSKPQFQWKELRDVRMKVSDGCELALDLFLPISDKPLPTLFAASAYGKDPQSMGVPQQPAESMTFDHMVEAGNISYFASRGYNYVIVDLRGVGKSDGEWHGFYSVQDQRDCFDVIEWIARQPWSDGKVGMMGHSYFGVMQLLVAALQPPALKAIAPVEAFIDFYDRARPGGIVSSWYWFLLHYCAAHTPLLVSERRYGKERLEEITAELFKDPDFHKNSFYVREFNAPKKDAPFFDLLLHPTKGDFWNERSPRHQFPNINIPIYGGGFWGYYTYIDGVFDSLIDERLDVPKRVGVLSYGTSWAKLPLKLYDEDLLRWYDHWLKGVDTGLSEEPPIKILVMGIYKYRFEKEWPLARTKWTKFYLRRYGELSTESDSDGSHPPDVLVHTPPVATMDYAPLTYETPPLYEDVEITGPLALHLHAAIDTQDANFVGQLFDVAPDGHRTLLSRAYLKASHRRIDPATSKPWRPVLPHDDPQPVKPGEVVKYEIPFSPISNVFRRGHRIALTISSTDAVLPKKGGSHGLGAVIEDKMPAMGIAPSQQQIIYRVFRDEQRDSHLLMPLIPLESTNDDQWVQSIE